MTSSPEQERGPVPPGTPSGTPVDIPLGAFVTGSGQPPVQNTPQGFSQIQLRAVFNRPRELKQQCVADLTALQAEVAASGLPRGEARRLRNRLDEVAGHIRTSLDPGLWLDDFHLRVPAGARVYAQEMVAAIQQMQLLMPEAPVPSWNVTLDRCTRRLVNAERIIAQTAVQDAGGGPTSPEAMLVNEGDRLERAGAFAAAIRRYMRSWQTAVP